MVLWGFIRVCVSKGDMRGRNVPPGGERKKKECIRREKEELKKGAQAAVELGNPGTPGLVWSRAHQPASPFPLCFVRVKFG